MNLLDRYIAAVKRHLPADSRDDVGAELQGLIEDRIEAEGERRGAPLDDNAVAAMLRDYGHPEKVAASYRPVTALVGSDAYALYRRILSRLLSVWFVVMVAIGVNEMLGHHGGWAIYAVPGFWHGVVDTLLALFFVVTMIFHFWGETLDRIGLGWRWDPARLPAATAAWIAIPKTGVVLAMIGLVSLLGAITADHYAYGDAGVSLSISPPVVALLPALRGLVLLLLALNALHLFQPHWTRLKLYASAAVSLALGVLLAYAAGAHRVLQLAEQGPEATASGNAFLAVWPETVLKIVVAGIVLLLLRSAWRSLRAVRSQGLPAF
jgi:hypothetical protein